MSEKKVDNRSNMGSLPILRMELSEVQSANQRIDCHDEAGLAINEPGIEMETIVTKLINHLRKNN